MKRSRNRAWSVVAALASSAVLLPLLAPSVANAAGVLQGAAEVRNAGGAAVLNTGNSDTTFTLRLPAGAACTGDSANDGYRVQSYMVRASVNPSTLQFNAAGPTPGGLGASFSQPLFTTASSGYVNANTANATTPPGPGPIVNIPDFNMAVFSPGDIPAGAYNLGIACTLGAASTTQMRGYWNIPVTVTTNVATGGTAQVTWNVGAVPTAPTLTAVTVGESQLTAAFTPVASTPATSGFTATATPPSGPAITATGASSPIVIPGLTNGTAYSVTVRATNTAGNSTESNSISGTPAIAARPPVTGLTAVPGSAGEVLVSWTGPTGPAPTGYSLTVAPADAGPFTPGASATSQNVTGLTAGTLYSFTVTPTHVAPNFATPASVQATPLSAQILQQQLTVTRPVGALVLTQVCGVNGALGVEAAQLGFPAGTLPAVAADTVGSAPFTNWPGTVQQDSATFAEYPYPVDDVTGVPNATYPTNCGIDLGIAKLVTSGLGSGQFFRASGVLNQVSVVDTRDADLGWTVNGTMSAFTSGANTFSGSQLGWTPVVTDDSDAFTDSNGTAYDQVVLPGTGVAPNTANASGLSSGRSLGTASGGSGLGIGVLDARLKLLIPVTANSGVYSGILSITSI